MNPSKRHTAPAIFKVMAVLMAVAVLLQGGMVSAATMSCHVSGITRVALNQADCGDMHAEEVAEPVISSCCTSDETDGEPVHFAPESHCLDVHCCDVEVTTKSVEANYRAADKGIDLSAVVAPDFDQPLVPALLALHTASPAAAADPPWARNDFRSLYCCYRL